MGWGVDSEVSFSNTAFKGGWIFRFFGSNFYLKGKLNFCMLTLQGSVRKALLKSSGFRKVEGEQKEEFEILSWYGWSLGTCMINGRQQ